MEKKNRNVQLVECPRDAMQGWANFIPTEKKVEYLNSLLQVGFDTLDFGSFVSPKAIPQMADTAEIVPQLQRNGSQTKLLAIVANTRGAIDAVAFDEIYYLGYPFSVSETFQQRNTHAGIAESFERVKEIQSLALKHGKTLQIYISMGFGNPYNDPYNEDIVFDWVNKLSGIGIEHIALADTVGLATAEQVYRMTKYVIEAFPKVSVGVHLHSTMHNWQEKADAALEAGCMKFDSALKGIGGCPMAGSELVGNMNTEWLIAHFEEKNIMGSLNKEALHKSLQLASEIFI